MRHVTAVSRVADDRAPLQLTGVRAFEHDWCRRLRLTQRIGLATTRRPGASTSVRRSSAAVLGLTLVPRPNAMFPAKPWHSSSR